MHPFTITALLLALGTSPLVHATPTPVVEARQDETFPYPIVATYEAVMREVDPSYQSFLEESIVIRLDEPASKQRDVASVAGGIEERQSGTCDIQGCVISFSFFFYLCSPSMSFHSFFFTPLTPFNPLPPPFVSSSYNTTRK